MEPVHEGQVEIVDAIARFDEEAVACRQAGALEAVGLPILAGRQNEW